MLSVFPNLLSYWLFAPFLLRLVSGIFFLTFGIQGLTKGKQRRQEIFASLNLKPAKFLGIAYSVLEIISSLLILVGLFTQVAAGALALICITSITLKIKHPEMIKKDINVYILLLVILISLLLLGGGRLAMDLPL